MTFPANAPDASPIGTFTEVSALHAATKASVDAVTAKLIAAPATAANQATVLSALGAPADAAYTTGNGTLVALLKAMLASLNDTSAAATVSEATTQRIGTRAYGATQRIAVATASTSTGAVVTLPKGEVMLQADTDCFIQIGTGGSAATATTTTSIPLVAGEKFHLQAPTGQFIAVIRKTADGFLYITPVA
jgi:hypothetical protein